MIRSIAPCIILFALLAGSCTQKQETGTVIARVEQSVLTLEELYESIPTEYVSIMTRKQYADYADRWVESEILCREAEKNGYDKLVPIARQIEKARRDILVAEAIHQLCPPSNNISEYRIEKYYEQHQNEFVRQEWEIKSQLILIPDFKTAWDVRNRVTVENFMELARKYSIDPVDDPEKIPFVAAGDMLPELAAECFKIRPGGTTTPIQAPRGYYIIRILDKQPPQSLRPISEVKEEIVNRLSSEIQKEQVKDLVDRLRKNVSVRIDLDRLPSQASSPSSAEKEPGDSDGNSQRTNP